MAFAVRRQRIIKNGKPRDPPGLLLEARPADSATPKVSMMMEGNIVPLPQKASGDQLDKLIRIARDPEASNKFLLIHDSYKRTEALAWLMMAAEPPILVQLYLQWADMCDAPWPWRSIFAAELRRALTSVDLREVLTPNARAFFDALRPLVPIWRGCQRGRERGLFWTTDRTVAEGFATGKRCINPAPTLVGAVIPKPHIFGVFIDREESEIAVDPRRLRNFQIVAAHSERVPV